MDSYVRPYFSDMTDRLNPREDSRNILTVRRSIRLKNYDYSWPGGYFVTICTQGKKCLYGDIANDRVHLNEAGLMVSKWWVKMAGKFQSISLDQFIVMPNHLHGIVIIVGADPCVRPKMSGADGTGAHTGAPLQTIIQWFKTMTTNEYIRAVKEHGWARFEKSLWQRNFYEHIIRNEDDLDDIREYIAYNPSKWATDSENPLTDSSK